MCYNAGCIYTITLLARCWSAVSSVLYLALPGSSLYIISSHRSFQSSLHGTYNTHSALITEHNLFLFFSHPRQVWYAINPALKLMFICFKLLLLSLFIGLFSRTTWVSRYRRGKTSLDLNGTRDDGVWGLQWHQLDHMQTICTLLQTGNHTNTSSFNFLQAGCSS